MKLDIVPGRLRFCGQLCRALRVDHAYALMRRDVPIHRELRAMFARSFYTRAAFIDGHLAAMWGAEGSMIGSEAFLWLALSQYALRYPVTVLRHARREIELLASTRQTLVTTVIPEDEPALRLATFLGFESPDGFGGGPARSAISRRNLIQYMERSPHLLVQAGGAQQIGLVWHREAS